MSVYLDLSLNDAAGLSAGLDALPGDTELTALLAVANSRVAQTASLLERVIGELDEIGDNTSTYTQQLLTTTGEISTDSDPGPDVAPTSTGPNNDLIASHGASVGQPQEDLALGDVKLWVSNQSFEDDPVAITIRINESVVVDDSFLVEGQHNWTAFDIAGLEPGKHQLTAESDTGAQLAGVFTLPENESRWLVVDYWFYVDEDTGRYFTFSESDEPVAFA